MTRRLRLALAVLAVAVIAVAAAAGAFLAGVEVNGGFLRPRLESALTAAFGMPTRIEGPLRLRTGPKATLSADALVVTDPSSGTTVARGIRPTARIDLAALLRRSVDLEEVSGEGLELDLRVGDDGRANWAPMFTRTSSGPAPVSFEGIARLRIGRIAGNYRRGSTLPTHFAIDAYTGGWRPGEALAGAGSLSIAGQSIRFDLRSLPAAVAAAGGPLLRGTVDWSGLRIRLDGRVGGGALFAGEFSAAADDATGLLAALGVAARGPGPLTAHGRLKLAATEAGASELELSIGANKAAGSARWAWGGDKPGIAVDLAGERIDVTPFAGDGQPADFTAATEAVLGTLERMANSAGAEIKLAAQTLEGAPLAISELRLEAGSGQGAVSLRAAAEVAGTPINATLAYDTGSAKRKLQISVDSGTVPAAALRREGLAREVIGRIGSVRGRLRGEGENPRAIVASAAGEFEARGVDWKLDQPAAPPLAGHFDTLRIGVQGARPSSVQVTGRIGGAACRLTVSAPGIAPLLGGESWPLRLSANCPGERIEANGSVTYAGRLKHADLAFDFSADSSGPAARALGVPQALPHPIAARGRLAVDEDRVLARLAALRLGRSAGAGEIELGREAKREAVRLQLKLTTLDLDEFAAASEASPSTSALERPVLQPLSALPDVDFDIDAASVDAGGLRLRDLKFSGKTRAPALQAAFQFTWQGSPLRGQLAANAGSASPKLELEATVQTFDFGPLMARLGFGGVKLRAEKLSLAAAARGERVADLLATATVAATIDNAQVDLGHRPVPGLEGKGTLSATLDVQPGRPAMLTARGRIDEQPIEISVEAPGIEALARPGVTFPLSVRATLAEMQIEAEGRVALGGAQRAQAGPPAAARAGAEGASPGRADLRLRLAGPRLERLGALLGVALPDTAPYDASGRLAVAAGSVEISSLDARIGSSRLGGSLSRELRPGQRPLYAANLRATALHLEDLLGRQPPPDRGPEAEDAAEMSLVRRLITAIDQRLDLLRAADARIALDVDGLFASGESLGSGRLRSTLAAAQLAVELQELRTKQGRAEASIRVDAGGQRPRFELRADIRDFEYGPLWRSVDPSSRLDGHLDLIGRLTLPGPARELEALLAGAVDIAVYPRGVRSAAIGLLGTSIVPAILRQIDPRSESGIECSVSGFTIGEGMARSNGFFILTTHARIIGELEAALATGSISGRFVPKPTARQLFALSPTLLVGGTLRSPTVSVAAENLLLVPLRFATPLTLFATDWLSGTRSSGGAPGCREAFERVRAAQAAAGS